MKNKEAWAVIRQQTQARSSLDPDSTLEVRSSSSSTELTPSDESEIKRVLRVSRLLIKSQKLQDALYLIEEILQKHPAHAELLILQGECLKSSGDLTKAIACFAKAEAYDASNAEAVLQLASIYHKQGNLHQCLELVRRANDLQPENKEFKTILAGVLSDLGTALKNEGKQEEAMGRYQEALEAHPRFPPALYNLGVACTEALEVFISLSHILQKHSSTWQVDKALEYYKMAVEEDPQHFMAWGNMATIYFDRRQFEDSLHCHRQALTVQPELGTLQQSYARLLSVLGAQAKEAGKTEEAINLYHEALSHHPACVEALYNLAVALTEAGEKQRAIFVYETAIHHNCHLPEIHNNLGVLYKEVGREQKAIQCYQNALALQPNFAMSLSNLGLLYAMQGQAEEAIRNIKAAIQSNPQYFEAYNNLGVVQKDIGLTHESLESYKQCLEISPSCRSPADNFLLGLNYVVCGASPVVSEHHLKWGAAIAEQLPQLPPIDLSVRDLDPSKVLKIGYLSGDLCTHSVSYFAEAPLSEHDPRHFQLIVYNCSPRSDDKTAILQAKVKGLQGLWKDIAQLTERDLAELIRKDDVDILVELSGHTSHNRLGTLAMKPAPIQVTWIGYPNSTGLTQIDYRFTDAHCDPEDTTQHFAEELIRLPHCFLCYTPYIDPPPPVPAPCLENGYVTFGSFNNLAKITDEVIRTWSGILLAIPEARLVLKNKSFACASIRAQFSQRFEREGIASWRIDLLPLSVQTKDHLSQYALMDISLDPWPYAGTTTTCESLFMGVPCLTLAGNCHAQNVGVSLLRAVGLDESWIATTVNGYKRQAIEKASDFEALAKLHMHLRVQMLSSELCNARGHVQRLEAEYRKIWKKWTKMNDIDSI